jgi:NAD(P)H-hydrate epimerase
MTKSTELPPLPPRPADSNKGTFGRVLIIGGSRGMSGAATLAGLGALRGGAGLVELAIPSGIQAIVAGIEPCWMTTGLPEDGDGRLTDHAFSAIESRWKTASAVAIGPGWGVTAATHQLARAVVERCPHPLVVDADALNTLADQPDMWRKSAAPRLITPHPGEFARLRNTTVTAIQSDRAAHARDFAKTHGIVVLLKGHETVITDGDRFAINTTGNAGMATGGTGDVLTGLLAALLAQKMTPYDAARLGAHLHGLAGDLAAAEFSEPGLIASDVARYLGRAWRTLSHRTEA